MVVRALRELSFLTVALGTLAVAAGNVAVQVTAVAAYAVWRYRCALATLRRRAEALRPTQPSRVIVGYLLVVALFTAVAINTTDKRLFITQAIVSVALVILALLHTAAAARISRQCQIAERVDRLADVVAAHHLPTNGK